jgi:Leucine-rich repeat (LRR) protein
LRSKKAFDGLLQLLTLNLSSNAISWIPTEAFYGLVSLQKMDLSSNLLERLDNKTNSIFEDCLSLQEVSCLVLCLKLTDLFDKTTILSYFVEVFKRTF